MITERHLKASPALVMADDEKRMSYDGGTASNVGLRLEGIGMNDERAVKANGEFLYPIPGISRQYPGA